MRPSETLEKHRDEVRRLISEMGASNPRIFGSTARGDDSEDSDLDILVEIEPPTTYYAVFRIEDALKKLLGVDVEVHTPGRPGSRFMQAIADDLRAI